MLLARWESEPSAGVKYLHGKLFDQLQIDTDTKTFSKNSILLLPNLLSQDERRLLMHATERAATNHAGRGESTLRVPVRSLGDDAVSIWGKILNQRVLPIVESELPGECRNMFGEKWRAGALQYHGDEPTINRYTAGGSFARHKDGMSMTVLCLLDTEGFEGGGTSFWIQDKVEEQPAVTLHAQEGVGVIFNGHLEHAGVAVVSGTRYALVASFSGTGCSSTHLLWYIVLRVCLIRHS